MTRPLRLPQRNKYRRVKESPEADRESCTYKGQLYHSRLEARYAATLDQLANASDPKERVVAWDRQVKFDLRVNGKHITNYFCDFRVYLADGRIEYREVKGFETEVWKLKKALLEATMPDIALKMVR